MRATDDENPPQPVTPNTSLEQSVVRSLHEFLNVINSPLIDGENVQEELDFQVHSIVSSAIAGLPGLYPEQESSAKLEPLNVGERRAQQGIHPSDSLLAANVLYTIALGEFLNAAGVDGPEREKTERVAGALHEAITAIVVPASVEYVNVLLERLSIAHTEERFGVSRDLHDRVAHGIAAALQRVTLLEQYPRAERAEEDQDLLSSVKSILEDTLADTRTIARELRQYVGDQTLHEALTDYVANLHANETIVVEPEMGTTFTLAKGTKEEAFIIIRELIINARRHAQAARISITANWTPQRAEYTVRDNGHGYDPSRTPIGRMGLISARERAEIVGGDLRIESGPTGTTTTLVLPARGARP